MKRKTYLTVICTILLINLSYAQDKVTADAKLNIFLTLPGHNDLGQKYKFGAGGLLGLSIYVPNINTYIVPQLGFDFMPRGVGDDDTYRENIFFNDFGVEGLYPLFTSNNYRLLPFIGLSLRQERDRYLVANGNININSNGSSEPDYDKQPPIFKGSGVALSMGLENKINNYFIRVSYELYQPKVTADLSHSYDSIDQEIFPTPTQKLNLSTVKIGFGAYFW